LVGSGRNGKGCFLKILDNFLGGDINVTSTSLDLISGNNKSRFESFRLYKKLVALMGETNFGLLTNTSLLKQLTGGDKIGFEKKGKDPFTGYNYAKIIIASNSLPTTQDTSDGFFRRWLIIDFPNEFPEGKDITRIIPEIEYNNLARKVINILPKLIERGSFTNQGEIEERRKKYIYASNPLPLFLKQCCILNDEEDTFISSAELYTAYIYYLKKHKKRRVKNKEFKVALEDEGFWADKTSKKVGITDEGYAKNKVTYWIDGIILVSDWKGRVLDSFAPFANNPTPLPTIEELKWEIGQKEQNTQQTEQIEQTIHHRCSICNANESHYWADNGKPICRDCYGAKSAQKGLK
jgi:P4 family phage/plasmid primase-like protien